MCAPIKTLPAIQVAVYYPAQHCIRYDADANGYRTALDQLVYREAAR